VSCREEGSGDADVRQRLGELTVAPVAGRIRRLLGHGGHDAQPLVVAVDQGTAWMGLILEASQALDLKRRRHWAMVWG
jgi:hypothetical protein